MINKLCIIGVGLIGGSLACALKAQNACNTIVGYGRHPANLQRALELQVIDAYYTEIQPAIQGADMILVAVPLGAMASVFAQIKPHLAENAIVTDVGSAKQSVIEAAKSVFGADTPFLVPAHPIAGLEKSGVEAAIATLFTNRRVIITPLPENPPAVVETVRWMWQQTGAIVDTMTAQHHDEVLAATSHLPHILAYCLVDTLARMDEHTEIFQFAAGGFRDFTRIAASDPTMWHDICIANQPALTKVLARFQQELTQLSSWIEQQQGPELLAVFQRAKAERDQFTG